MLEKAPTRHTKRLGACTPELLSDATVEQGTSLQVLAHVLGVTLGGPNAVVLPEHIGSNPPDYMPRWRLSGRKLAKGVSRKGFPP